MIEQVFQLLKSNVAISFTSPRMGKMRRRRLIGARIQDTLTDPLDPFVSERIPPSCRGRWAITGHDPDRGEDRTYFLEFIDKVEVISPNDGPFEIILCDDECSLEKASEAPSFQAAVAWMREWLNEPLDLVVGLRKPKL
ncbi:hypothetical protein NA78x_001802 [Anatilimnocola sp. NA78]|uniref:hypothetical protein n=1 Tax=Anatilimnocola sp. NA78 TaxID=3415683 RepID=UPI003CE5C717